jgi:hypothetical protein
MRLHAQTALIENGFVRIPEDAPWLAEYLHEVTVFPNGRHDDQVDSTAQFLDWYKRPFPSQGHFEWMRQRAEKIQQRNKPPPPKIVFAPGSMEWQAEQEKASRIETSLQPPYPSQATQQQGRNNRASAARD